MIIYAKLQCSHVRHQYGIFGGKSQTSFLRNATWAGSEEGRLFSEAILYQVDDFWDSHYLFGWQLIKITRRNKKQITLT